MLYRLVFVFALSAAPCAVAQVPDIQQARAHADAVILRGDASAWFANITTSDRPTVRHIPSGMTCEFVGVDDRDVIRLYNQAPSTPARGDDVSCGTWIGRTYVTVFATRYQELPPQDQLLESAVAQLTRNWPQARPSEASFEVLTLEGQDQPLIAVFDVELEGNASRSVVLIQNIGAWSFKARATGPGTDGTAVEFGTMQFALSLPGGIEAAAAATTSD